jgi:flavodoxin
MKTLIIYSSMTGNTKKLAEAINGEWIGEKILCSIEDAPDPKEYDLVLLGFWLMAGKPDPRSAEYLKMIGKKKLFLFVTHGAAAGSDHVREAMNSATSLADSAELLGTFSCQGEVAPHVLKKARAKNPPPVWIEGSKSAVGHPDGTDIQRLSETLAAATSSLFT